jgi:hypothetical protein
MWGSHLTRKQTKFGKLKKENARSSPCSILLAFSQSYVKYDLRKNKIVAAFTTGFFGH